MRSKIVENQLKQVSYADLSHYDPTIGVFNIPKYSKPIYEVGKMYIVEVAQELVCNKDSVLAANWNNGTSPSGRFLRFYVSKMLGKMLYVDSVVFDMDRRADTAIIWSGWLPVDRLSQLEQC